jgi:hypothetical protein
MLLSVIDKNKVNDLSIIAGKFREPDISVEKTKTNPISETFYSLDLRL